MMVCVVWLDRILFQLYLFATIDRYVRFSWFLFLHIIHSPTSSHHFFPPPTATSTPIITTTVSYDTVVPRFDEETAENEEKKATADDDSHMDEEAPVVSKELPPQEEVKETDFKGSDWYGVRKKADAATAATAATTTPTTGTKPSSPASTSGGRRGKRNIIFPDGSIRLYWYDAYEVPYVRSGNVYLFGRALVPGTENETVSCCVTVQNVQRNLFLLPREFKLKNANDETSTTNEPVSMKDLYEEFHQIARRHHIPKFLSKPVTRKFAFEERTDGVPEEATYMKVVYSSKFPTLPRDLKGKTFSHCFGTKSSALELFMLKRNLMGPCWLKIDGVQVNEKPSSWCQTDVLIDSHKQIETVSESDKLPPPTMKTMAIGMKTALNPKSRQHEIVMISCLVHDGVSVDGPTANQDELRHFTVACPPNKGRWDLDTERNCKGKLIMTPNESALLNFFFSKLQLEDPDILLGHGLHGSMLDILMSRLRKVRVAFWSKLGRLKMSKLPQNSSSSFSYADMGIGAGRLLCDTDVSARELVRQKNYSMRHLAKSLLDVNKTEVDVHSVPAMFDSPTALMKLCRHNENDTYLSFAIMFKLVVIPLTRQLTSLTGHLWSRTLRSKRAERIEYLLLHEFHRLKYIAPEKYSSKEKRAKLEAAKKEKKKLEAAEKKQKKAAAAAATSSSDSAMDIEIHGDDLPAMGGEEDADDDSARTRRKPDYSGGLVLEPKRGFYDKFIVMLDFNSLYPSIIREFNICHTTVNFWDVPEETGIALVPDQDSAPGILPTVVTRLLERRTAVKRLMKAESNPVKRKQLDIRQQALKLVANSMYGCLGFPSSRFYCKPLAALITAQGRDILQRSKETAESEGFEVVYGDTDSIMIYTGTDDVHEARKMATLVKKAVNKCYKVLYLEIDAMYKTMLLLRKKKYAALIVNERPDKTLVVERETKGLDLVRRDWCELSKDVGNFILDKLLAGDDRENVITAIHEHLEQIAADIDSNKVMLNKFIITKGLTKDPKHYANSKNLPHVRVAQQMVTAGKTVRVGDYIPYVVCEGSGSIAERAYHPDVIIKAGGALSVDREWYKAQQVLPPIARLCEPIQETSTKRIAECLGLDAKKFGNVIDISDEVEDELDMPHVNSTFQEDAEAFRDCERLDVTCRYCQVKFPVSGVYNIEQGGEAGLQCPTKGCNGSVGDAVDISSVLNRVDLLIRKKVREFYGGYAVCTERMCKNRTRQRSIRTMKCLAPGCRGMMRPEVMDKQLYQQLRYFRSLFNVDKATNQMKVENVRRAKEQLPLLQSALPELNIKANKDLLFKVDKYLERCSYNVINLAPLFPPSQRQ